MRDDSAIDIIEESVGSKVQYQLLAQNTESTVVSEFVSDDKRKTIYQSEADLERELISILRNQAYEYLHVTNEQDLIRNLRKRLEFLNNIAFSDEEWAHFFKGCIAGDLDGIVEKTTRIQEDYVQLLKRDDGTTKNIYLIDKANIHNNCLQVLNQYETEGARTNRYDVTILVNGLPLVHVELKRRGIDLKEAFNQINRYQRDSFWAGSGLFEYVQIFIISNGTLTKYYSNTTRFQHLKERMGGGKNKSRATSYSFEFTSWWADANNKPIYDLTDFARTFLAKHTLLNILTRYCVFTAEKMLLVMRPYQIVATERILNRILISENDKRKLGTVAAGGYIWHTTGSGKTLTSFKTAQLATSLEGVEKVLFVVDRKDLDIQTKKEYDRFEKGAADSNISTAILKKQLGDTQSKIIITTIQKLSSFIKQNKGHRIFEGHIVIIFDECHRSQFGDMHTSIIKAFKNYHLFGFTGTPIFAANAGQGGNLQLKTTEQAFGEKLHTYTIVDAISDKNVLPFRIDYNDTIKMRDDIKDKKVSAIDREQALLAPERISKIVNYTLEHFAQKTKRNHSYKLDDQRLYGFNALFATQSIEAAKRYYMEFKHQQEEHKGERLKIALIYSFISNEDEPSGFLADEQFELEGLDQSSRDFLDAAIVDYNDLFDTNYDTSADKFYNYYIDLSERIRKRKVDLTIVANMFLTGFDATTLNTLWVDKNLQQHGLLQAFSRTNRILNSVKTFGNIVCFRDLEQETNDAIALFGNKDAGGIVLLKPYAEYYGEYEKRIAELIQRYPLGEAIIGEEFQKEFIKLYGSVLRLKNILTSFDEFFGSEILSERDFQDYQSLYLNLYQDWRTQQEGDKEIINDDIIFEIELIKQVEINIDYILMLVKKYRDGNCEDKEILVSAHHAVAASLSLRSKKDLIEQFVASVTVATQVDEDWKRFMLAKKAEELDSIIAEENLNPEETRTFIDNAFRDGAIQESGTAITAILPPARRFSADSVHAEKKQVIIDKLRAFFERFFEL